MTYVTMIIQVANQVWLGKAGSGSLRTEKGPTSLSPLLVPRGQHGLPDSRTRGTGRILLKLSDNLLVSHWLYWVAC